jgi:hypothetical protein
MKKREHFNSLKSQPQSIREAAHAVGLDCQAPYTRHGQECYKPYRNGFSVPDCGGRIWENFERTGKAAKDRDGIYYLTRAGLDWLGETLGITICDEMK